MEIEEAPRLHVEPGLKFVDRERSDRKRLLGRRAPASYPGPHLAVAAGWLILSSLAAVGTLSLADIEGRLWWIAAGVVLLLAGLMLAFVERVATWRDRVYGTSSTSSSGSPE